MNAPEKKNSLPALLKRYRRLWPYFKPARSSLMGGLLAGVGYALLSSVGVPFVLLAVVPVFFGDEKSAKPWVVHGARFLFGDDYHNKLLITACISLPVVFLLSGICAFANRYLVNRAGFIFLEQLRMAVFNRVQQLPLAFFQQHKSGDLVSRLVTDCEQLRMLAINASNDIIRQPLTLIGVMGFLVWISIENHSAFITLIALGSVPLCVIPIRMATRRLIRRSRMVARQSGELASSITESLQSPLEIQAYNLQTQQSRRFAERVQEIFRLSMKTVKYQSLTGPTVEFVSACGFAFALYFGVRSGISQDVFVAMGFALFRAYEPVKKLTALQGFVSSAQASLERLEQILDAEDTVSNPSRPQALPAAGEIVFSEVSFIYPSRQGEAQRALAEVSVRIRPGEIVALVGASGAGKSTFTLLLPRFYDPTEGAVTLGGVDLRAADKNALRDKIAIVPQMPVLFNASIADNIRVGRLAATDEAVKAAARQASVHEFIESLPQGYNTLVGERGALLSGGQRQRIAIARAFLKDAPILILDEATSALDSESEAMIQQALLKLVQGRTTFMIAHRFSSISLATRILVFEQGRITGDGTSAYLIQTHAAFRRMNELQKLD